MPAAVVAALLLPFVKGLLPMPGPRRGLFLRAESAPGLDETWRAALLIEQTWRPAFDALRRQGFVDLGDTAHANADEVFDTLLVHLTKDRAESFGLIERGWRKLARGGVLVVAGEKSTGAAATERTVSQLHSLEGHLPKHGCRVFWLRKREQTPAFASALQRWENEAAPRVIVDERYVSRPGLFSWDRVDAGSSFLAAHLPPDIAGRVADFGCGWGYLAAKIAERCSSIDTLTLIDAERMALDCAEANLASVSASVARSFDWADLTRPWEQGPRFDCVVTNPPFHDGAAADIGIARAFIDAAHAALVPGGRLLLVANRHLPYEAHLRERFRRLEEWAQDRRYKVLLAVR